jgi:hypothetical protein
MPNHTDEMIVRLSSGLGNQLFQLSHGMWLAVKSRAELRFDTTWFRLVSGIHPVKRQLRLNQFQFELPEAFRGLTRWAIGLLAALYDKNRHGKWALEKMGRLRIVQEEVGAAILHGTPKTASFPRTYLNGYWQWSEPYLAIRDRLLPKLVPKWQLSPGAQEQIDRTKTRSTGFMHVRRGDYLHFMGETGTLTARYYADALSDLKSAGKQVDQWLIFTEDIPWVSANLDFVPNARIVDFHSDNRDIEDLMIMKACSAGIIANSSYSWWGAALGERSERPIVAPDRYWKFADSAWSRWALPSWRPVSGWR